MSVSKINCLVGSACLKSGASVNKFLIWQNANFHSLVHLKETFSDPNLDKGAATPDIPTQNFLSKFKVPIKRFKFSLCCWCWPIEDFLTLVWTDCMSFLQNNVPQESHLRFKNSHFESLATRLAFLNFWATALRWSVWSSSFSE